MYRLSVFAAFCVAPFEGVTFFWGFCTGCLRPTVPVTDSRIRANNTINATTISTVISTVNTAKHATADDITHSMWLQPACGGNLRMLGLAIIMPASNLFAKITKFKYDNLVNTLDVTILALNSLAFSRDIRVHVTVVDQLNALRQVCVPKLSPHHPQPSKYPSSKYPSSMKRVRAL
jgi:hypothetical protein